MIGHETRTLPKISLVVAAILVVAGCETLRSLITVEPPIVTVEDVALTGLSFSGAELIATARVENPNPVEISLAGFSWDLFIEDNRFVGGVVTEGTQIAPEASSVVAIPVDLIFRDVLDTVVSIGEKTDAEYRLEVEFKFDLPILGPVTVPLQTQGSLPVVRLPRIRVASIRLDRITLTGAQLELDIAVTNPNSFGLAIDSLDYALLVSGISWVAGETTRSQKIEESAESLISFPFSLRFLDVGRAVRDILNANADIDYELNILASVSTDHPLIRSVDLPANLVGSIPISR